jgi:hypothetical protein
MGRLLHCIIHAQLHTDTILRKLIAVRRYILSVDCYVRATRQTSYLVLVVKSD